MAKPLVFTVKDKDGNLLSAKEIIMNGIKAIKSESIISEMTSGPQAKAILEDGQIARYRYFKNYFIGDQEETVIFNDIAAGGNVKSTIWIKDEVNIDLDDSRTTVPKLYRQQDAQALEENFADNAQIMMYTIERRREVRWFEQVRMVVRDNAALGDGIIRVVDTTSIAGTSEKERDENYTRLIQQSISSLIDFFDDIFSKDTVDALGIGPELLVGSFKHGILTSISNTQAFQGGSNSQGQLEKGTVNVLSNVELKHQGWMNGIDGVIMVRGAVQMPIGNVEKVEQKTGNFTKQWIRWDMPKLGSVEELFTYIIMFGDPAVINAA